MKRRDNAFALQDILPLLIRQFADWKIVGRLTVLLRRVRSVLETRLHVGLLKIRVVISRDRLEREAFLHEFEDIAHWNSRSRHTGFAEVHVGIDRDS